jgi:hypothetical protein
LLLLLLPAVILALLQPLQCSQPPCWPASFAVDWQSVQVKLVGPAAAMAPPFLPAVDNTA